MTELQQLHALLRPGRQPSIGPTLQFSGVEFQEGFAAFEGIPGEHAYNPIGTVHGGYAATLLDSACGCAVHSNSRLVNLTPRSSLRLLTTRL